MPRNTKKSRYMAAFSQAAHALGKGSRALVRHESQTDYRTIINYWYDWRKIYHGVNVKSPDPEVRRLADVVLNSVVRIDTDDQGRIVLVIAPRITPGPQIVTSEHVIQGPEPLVGISTGHGTSAAPAAAGEADYYMIHTKPWQDWFKAEGPGDHLSWMFKCLDSIPREMRGNPDLASIDDLPPFNSPEGQAFRGRFKEILV